MDTEKTAMFRRFLPRNMFSWNWLLSQTEACRVLDWTVCRGTLYSSIWGGEYTGVNKGPDASEFYEISCDY